MVLSWLRADYTDCVENHTSTHMPSLDGMGAKPVSFGAYPMTHDLQTGAIEQLFDAVDASIRALILANGGQIFVDGPMLTAVSREQFAALLARVRELEAEKADDTRRLDWVEQTLRDRRVVNISRKYVGGQRDEAIDGSAYTVLVHGMYAPCAVYYSDAASPRQAIDTAMASPTGSAGGET